MGLIHVPGRRVDPNYTPGFPVEVDPSHPLAEGLVAFIAILDDPVPDYDLLGNPITWTKSWSTVNMVSEPTEFGPVQKNVGTSSRTYGVEAAIPVDSSLLYAGDITCLCDVDIGYLVNDVGLITLNDSAWSWLDTSGGVLRTSAYTAYDTTNPINSYGSNKIGLIWRKDNTYQTIADGRFSQSGSATRQSISGGYAKTSRGAATYPLWQSGTDGNTATPRWWGLWSRSLSEDECFSVFNAPLQIFRPIGARRIWVPVSAGSTASGAASGNEVTTSSVIGSSLFNGVLSGNEVTTSSIVGASTHDAVASGNAVVASSVIGASTFDGAASGNAVVTSSIVGDSVAAGSAVASGNAVVTSSIVGASVFNGIALGDIVVTGSFVGQGAVTSGAASGAIVVSASFVSDAPVTEEAQAGGGKGSSRKKRVIYERIEDVEDFVEAMESEVLQEPKVKAKLRKVKKLKPETVENTEESANAWIEYYDDLLQALRDHERAEQIRRDLENSAYMLQTALRNREMQDLMRIEALRQEENLILLLMAA